MNRLRRVETFARTGYLARGIVYVMLGYLAYATARSKSPGNVLAEIKDIPAGEPVLLLVGIGLGFYGLFRLYGAALDIDGHGSGALGAAKRIGHLASGLGHLVLAYVAARAASGRATPPRNGEGAGTEQAASVLLSLPAGEVVLAVIGLGFIAAAFDQAAKAWTGSFMHDLDADAPRAVRYVGQAGHAARALVFAIIGWNIASSALAGNAEEVGGIGLALDKLRANDTLFSMVAIGLLLFGVFSIVTARYRRICDEDVIARLKGELSG